MPTMSKPMLQAIRAHLLSDVPNRLGRFSVSDMVDAIDRAMRTRRGVTNRKVDVASRKSARKGRTATIRETVEIRAAGHCECGCDAEVAPLYKVTNTSDLDHFFGGSGRRLALESVETCWLLRPLCHREKTNNRPSAEYWLLRFRAHASRHGYAQAVDLVDKRLGRLRAEAEIRGLRTQG